MSALIAMWRDNPVMVKEFRVRMRGSRAYWIITGYLLFLSLILFMLYTNWWNETVAEGHNLASGSKIGQEFLLWITVTQAFLVAFITPAITSGAITIEREQRTLEMLELTRLSPGQVVLGKLSSAVGFVVLLLISSVPLASICFFLGGVSPEQIGYTYLMLMSAAFVAGTLGLVWSSVARTTAAAVILTYGSLFAPFVLLFLVGIISMSSRGPGWDIQLILSNLLGIFGVPSPDELFSPIAPYFRFWDHSRYYGLTVPAWLPGVTSYAMIGVVLAATAAVRLSARPEKRNGLLRWMVLALFVEQAFFFFGARFCVYTSTAPVALSQMLAGYPLVLHLLYPVLLLLLVAPIFCTGDVRPAEARSFGRTIALGWSRLGWGDARIAAGWPYMCVLALAIVGMFALSFVAVGHGSEALQARIGPAPVWPTAAGFRSPNITIPMPAAPAAPAGSRYALLSIAGMLLAVVTGLFFLGLFLSLAFRNRWVAVMLMYAGLVLILVAPPIAYASYASGAVSPGADREQPSVFINLYYLNPSFPISQMGDPSGTMLRNVPLMFGQTPPWKITTLLYSVIAFVSCLLAAPFVTRTAARNVLPYEGLGARA